MKNSLVQVLPLKKKLRSSQSVGAGVVGGSTGTGVGVGVGLGVGLRVGSSVGPLKLGKEIELSCSDEKMTRRLLTWFILTELGEVKV